MTSIKISIKNNALGLKNRMQILDDLSDCFIKCIGNERQKKIITLEHLLGSSHLSTVFRCTLSSFRYTSCNTSVKQAVHKKCSLKAIRFYTMRIGLGYNESLFYDQSWICMSSCMLVHIHMEQLLTLLLPFVCTHKTTCNMLNRFPKNVKWWV